MSQCMPSGAYPHCMYHEYHFLSFCFLRQLTERTPAVCQKTPVTGLDSRQVPHLLHSPTLIYASKSCWMPTTCISGLAWWGRRQRQEKRSRLGWQGIKPPPTRTRSLANSSPVLAETGWKVALLRAPTQRSHSYISLQAGTAPTATRKRHLSLPFPLTPRMSLIRLSLLSAATIVGAMEVQ